MTKITKLLFLSLAPSGNSYTIKNDLESATPKLDQKLGRTQRNGPYCNVNELLVPENGSEWKCESGNDQAAENEKCYLQCKENYKLEEGKDKTEPSKDIRGIKRVTAIQTIDPGAGSDAKILNADFRVECNSRE